jgi:lysozyme
MNIFTWLFGKKTAPAPKPVSVESRTHIPPPVDSTINGQALSPSEACIALIKREEGLLLTAKPDVDGVYVNGYGCKIIEGKPAFKGQVITPEIADHSCRVHAQKCAEAVITSVNHPLTQGQLDALVDFVYNAGSPALHQSTLLRVINSNQQVIERYFTMWNKAHINGVLTELPDLTARRKAEYQLYLS